ncbi:MAG: glycosyltransferase family 2 protein [Selenomonadaceae bacterium]|nr:glycosyltransferase family 2 protein [Selenomonadaceae bacterium]
MSEYNVKDESIVSMVIACFNKEKYIGELIESILNQSYKKLQIIFVDDGSTDRTSKIIDSYENKIVSEGMLFEFIKQKNTGVAVAVSNGLAKICGDYVCMPDADDVLESNYVKEMIMCLENHPSADWCVCDSNRTRWTKNIAEYTDDIHYTTYFKCLLERYILMCNQGMVWQLMIRADYLRKTKVRECLSILGWSTTHEAPVWIPLINGQGKGIYFPKRLYFFRDSFGSLSNPGDAEKVLRYSRMYREAIISSLKFCAIEDQRLMLLAYFREYMEILVHAPVLKEYVSIMLSDKLQRSGFINRHLEADRLINEGDTPCYHFCVWLWRTFIPQFNRCSLVSRKNDIVAYGVLGKRAARMLPIINASSWKPTKFWDMNGADIFVQRPDFSELKEGDTVLCFPINDEIVNTVKKQIPKGVSLIYGIELSMLAESLQYLDFPIINDRGLVSLFTED